MGGLFSKNVDLQNDELANSTFTTSHKGMTDEINRVASEPVTVWGKITSWIYNSIFGDPRHIKEFQTIEEKYRSSEAFDKLRNRMAKKSDNSLSNDQIMNVTRKTFP
jgi:hypothetical protein